MAPYHEQMHLANGVKAYMDSIAEQKSLRFDKKIVGSEEFKNFLFHLSNRAPFALDRLLKKVSRNCADILRKERDARKNKKRVASPKCDARNIKRRKTSYTVAEETFQQVGTNGDKEAPMKTESFSPQSNAQFTTSYTIAEETFQPVETNGDKEAPMKTENLSPQSNAQFTKTALPNTLVLDIGRESGRSERFVVSTKYEIECGLMMGSPIVEAYVRASLKALKPSTERPSFNIDNEIAKVWKIIPFLEFYKTRRELGQHLENREKTTDEKLQSRTIWSSSDPAEILETLENVRMSTLDNKIHRAYGQTILVSSVDAQVARGCKTVKGHRSDHMTIFEELACKKAGSVSKTELAQIASSYFYEYQSGQKWLAVIDWFGGSGIILIFIIAGIGAWYMSKWTEFQKCCVQHIAGILHSIRGLVETLGSDALERYCRHGRLGNNCLDRLKSAIFTKPDTDEGCGPVDPNFEDAGEGSGDAEAGSEDAGEESDDEDEESESSDEEEENKDDEYENVEAESEEDSD